MRVYPGLLVVLLLTVLVLGPAFTTLSLGAYFSDRGTLLYLPRNLTLKWLQYDLPGVFLNNPYPAAVNGSLWTLFYEAFVCYGMVAVVGVLGLMRRSWSFAAFLGVYVVGYLALKLVSPLHNFLLEHSSVANFHQLTLPFSFGHGLLPIPSVLEIGLDLGCRHGGCRLVGSRQLLVPGNVCAFLVLFDLLSGLSPL